MFRRHADYCIEFKAVNVAPKDVFEVLEFVAVFARRNTTSVSYRILHVKHVETAFFSPLLKVIARPVPAAITVQNLKR